MSYSILHRDEMLTGSQPTIAKYWPYLGLFNHISNGEKMFVGFSAPTGDTSVQDHYILAWSFTTEGTTPQLNISSLSSFAKRNSKRTCVGLIAGITMAVLVVF